MAEHTHKYHFLRQEKKRQGGVYNPTFLYTDVFYCEECGDYLHKKIKLTKPSTEWLDREDVVEEYDR